MGKVGNPARRTSLEGLHIQFHDLPTDYKIPKGRESGKSHEEEEILGGKIGKEDQDRKLKSMRSLWKTRKEDPGYIIFEKT